MVIDDVGGVSVDLIVAFIDTFCPCRYIYIQHKEHLILSCIVTQHSLHPNIKVKFESFLEKKNLKSDHRLREVKRTQLTHTHSNAAKLVIHV